ncbi:MAG: SPOR domain-containing protein [Candidatus Omnitrophota bacterium]
METKRDVQQELFEEFSQPANTKRKRLSHDTAKKIYTFTFSNEQMIFGSIGFIILLIICFSLGVEKGKRINRAVQPQIKQEQAAVIPAPESAIPAKKIEPIKRAPLLKAEPIKPKQEPVKPAVSDYVVQCAAHASKAGAEKEKALLVNNGYQALVIESGKYFVVYATGFSNKEQAKAACEKLKSKYKDCFVRRK